MKDLKLLLYFENLMQEAYNELILQAQSDGNICVAYVCKITPEPLLNLPGAFSTRLRAPRTGDGNGNLLHDELPLRVQPRPA